MARARDTTLPYSANRYYNRPRHGIDVILDDLFTFPFPLHLVIYLPSDIISSKDRKTLYDLQNNPSRNNLEGVLYNRDSSPTRDGSEATNGSCRLMPSFAYAELAKPKISLSGMSTVNLELTFCPKSISLDMVIRQSYLTKDNGSFFLSSNPRVPSI